MEIPGHQSYLSEVTQTQCSCLVLDIHFILCNLQRNDEVALSKFTWTLKVWRMFEDESVGV